jgi:kynureninase
MTITRQQALALDAVDELRDLKYEFYPLPGSIYMDGNSLGLLSRSAERTLLQALEQWRSYGIDGWDKGPNPWLELGRRLGELSAPLVGASPDEVIVTESTTVNLHQLVATFYHPCEGRTRILIDAMAFPSDLYALRSQIKLHGQYPGSELITVGVAGQKYLDEDEIVSAIEKNAGRLALILLPTVLYHSGQLLDVRRLTHAAHAHDILIGFDASHSIGAMPHTFAADGVDFAFWCNYKYVSGGPGACAGLYVNQQHLGRKAADPYSGLAGWFGAHPDSQFAMKRYFEPADDARAYQIGTPHILSMAPVLGALELIQRTGIDRIRARSLKLTAYMRDLINAELLEYGFTIGTPQPDHQRGGHIALVHPEARRICLALKARRVIPDFRHPDIIRLAPSPMYGSFSDVWDTIHSVRAIMQTGEYLDFPDHSRVP